ncbi:MAG: hypothetical protein QXJ75_05680 [Candidatus Bathyarchaeia archaeon]
MRLRNPLDRSYVVTVKGVEYQFPPRGEIEVPDDVGAVILANPRVMRILMTIEADPYASEISKLKEEVASLDVRVKRLESEVAALKVG